LRIGKRLRIRGLQIRAIPAIAYIRVLTEIFTILNKGAMRIVWSLLIILNFSSCTSNNEGNTTNTPEIPKDSLKDSIVVPTANKQPETQRLSSLHDI
jgi:hypothetical protein